MKILELTGMNSTKYGGLEKYFTELIKSSPNDKFYLCYEAPPANADFINTVTSNGGTFLYFPHLKNGTFQYFKFIARIIKEEKIDIVHFHFGKTSVAPILKCAFPKIRIIGTQHSEMHLGNSYKKPYRRVKKSIECSVFEKILCVSDGVRSGIKKELGTFLWNRIHSKFIVLYLGVPEKKVRNANLKDDLRIDPSTVIITSIGFNIRIKGFDILVKAIREIITSHRHDVPNFKILIVGLANEEEKRFKTLIAENHCESYFISLGIRNDIDDILNITDIYCQPSRTEAISLSIMEALRFGIPIIGSRVGGIPEIVHDKQNGLLFENGNPEDLAIKLTTLLTDEQTKNTLGDNSLVIASQFSIKSSVLSLLDIYHRTH